MAKYLVDVNLPRYFLLWSSEEYVHVRDIDDEWTDEEIWSYAKLNSLTIMTKDADFTERILISTPPPRVIHIKVGNMLMKDFHRKISSAWDNICQLSEKKKLVQVFRDRIETIE